MNSGGNEMVRLYHYLEACWALDDIRRRRLKLSSLLDVNDTYEFACVYSTDKVTQETLEESSLKLPASRLVGKGCTERACGRATAGNQMPPSFRFRVWVGCTTAMHGAKPRRW